MKINIYLYILEYFPLKRKKCKKTFKSFLIQQKRQEKEKRYYYFY